MATQFCRSCGKESHVEDSLGDSKRCPNCGSRKTNLIEPPKSVQNVPAASKPAAPTMPQGASVAVRGGVSASQYAKATVPNELRREVNKVVSCGGGDRQRLGELIEQCKAYVDGHAALSEARQNCDSRWHGLAIDLEKAIGNWEESQDSIGREMEPVEISAPAAISNQPSQRRWWQFWKRAKCPTCGGPVKSGIKEAGLWCSSCGKAFPVLSKAELDRRLICAVENLRLQEVRSLIAAGARVNAKDENGLTPLHKAASGRHKEIVLELLIGKRSDVNARTNKGETPLHIAASGGCVEVVELLLARKADIGAKAEDGSTPYDRAQSNGHEEVLLALFRADLDDHFERYKKNSAQLLVDYEALVKAAIEKPFSESRKEICRDALWRARSIIRNGRFKLRTSQLYDELGLPPEAKERQTMSDKSASAVDAANRDKMLQELEKYWEKSGDEVRINEKRFTELGIPCLEMLKGIARDRSIKLHLRKASIACAVAFDDANKADFLAEFVNGKNPGALYAAYENGDSKSGEDFGLFRTAKDYLEKMGHTFTITKVSAADGKIAQIEYRRLKCSKCAKVFKIGVDSVVVAPEVALTTLTSVTIGAVPSLPDLVSTVRSEDMASGAMERMKPHWGMIHDSLTRGDSRKWKCYDCSTINNYKY